MSDFQSPYQQFLEKAESDTPTAWRGTGSNVKVLTREFDRNHPFGEIFPPRHYDIEGRDILDAALERAWVIYQERVPVSAGDGEYRPTETAHPKSVSNG